MLSRVAENLFWLGRYLERAENIARMARVEHEVSLESGQEIWHSLVSTTASNQLFWDTLADSPDLTHSEFLIYSMQNPASLRATLVRARELARGLREHISREVWEEINALYLYLALRKEYIASDIQQFCTETQRRTQTILGLYDNTVLRDEGREWFRCGMYLERADMTSRIIDAKYHILLPRGDSVGGPFDRFQWMAVLRSASAREAYWRMGNSEVDGIIVAQLLVFSQEFPRSLAFCVQALQRHFHQATGQTPKRRRAGAERGITLLHLDIGARDMDQLIDEGLHEFIDDFQQRLIDIDRSITDDIFRAEPSHGQLQRTAASDRG
ncbi:MAG: alpha-E domain-containing protein [Chloroflexi bacterium]|nr:alpha-E domain-containing protein [Chloroflexota bacterium]MYI04141.1 alpha-E domain-containing protein [Chloroflexota bacterium]